MRALIETISLKDFFTTNGVRKGLAIIQYSERGFIRKCGAQKAMQLAGMGLSQHKG